MDLIVVIKVEEEEKSTLDNIMTPQNGYTTMEITQI